MLVKYELAKVLVVGNEDALFSYCKGQDLGVWYAARMLSSYTDGIMAKGAKVGNKAGISTLIEKKPHTWARGGEASLGWERTRFLVTAA
jgi:hypothetical protein